MKTRMHPPDRSTIPLLILPEQRAERLVATFLERMGSDHGPTPFLALLRSAMSDPNAAVLLRQLFEQEIVVHVSKTVGTEHASLRVALIASELLGIGAIRYILKLEPVASMPIEEVARLVAPALSSLLDPKYVFKMLDKKSIT